MTMTSQKCEYEVNETLHRDLLARGENDAWFVPKDTCGQPATHLCLVERIGEPGPQPGPQSGSEHRCERHTSAADVIDAWALRGQQLTGTYTKLSRTKQR